MGLTKSYFFDTYAFFEIMNANPNYAKYEKVVGATTRFNLMELHYGLLRGYNKSFADEKYDKLLGMAIEIDDQTIKKANEFRLLNKKRKFSYIDCIGYTMAKNRGMAFLTGDKAFEGLENVELVK